MAKRGMRRLIPVKIGFTAALRQRQVGRETGRDKKGKGRDGNGPPTLERPSLNPWLVHRAR